MLFSVLMANYNNGRYIEEAVESVKNQTYENWEIIIVDDSSTDESDKVLSRIKENPCIHMYKNEQNRGCGYTKRRCVELADGEICGFLDPDDTLHPDALKIMIENHKKFNDYGLIYASHYACDDQLNIKFIPKWIGELKEGESHLFNHKITHFATFKRACYEQTAGIDPAFKRAVDQDLYFKLEEVTKTKFIDQPLYYYRMHQNGISSFSNKEKARYWHLMAGFNTCERRNINKEQYFKHFLKWEKRKLLAKSKSKDYKLGHFLLKPVRKIRSFLFGIFANVGEKFGGQNTLS